METPKKNYAGYRPKKANIIKLEAYISQPKGSGKVSVSPKTNRVLKNKRY